LAKKTRTAVGTVTIRKESVRPTEDETRAVKTFRDMIVGTDLGGGLEEKIRIMESVFKAPKDRSASSGIAVIAQKGGTMYVYIPHKQDKRHKDALAGDVMMNRAKDAREIVVFFNNDLSTSPFLQQLMLF